MKIFYEYLDCFLPKLREVNYKLWLKIIILYKIILPCVLLTFQITLHNEITNLQNFVFFSNLLMIFIGFENTIGVLSWLVNEKFSIYTLVFPILQYFIDQKKFQKEINNTQQCQNALTLWSIICQFHRILFQITSWINIRTMIPAIYMLGIITIITRQKQLIIQLIKRNIPIKMKDISKEYNLQEENECNICMDNIKIKELVTYLPCQHLFHSICFWKWQSYNSTCPLCRMQIDLENVSKNIQNQQDKIQFIISETQL